MFQNLTALGYSIIAFTILVVIGIVVIGQLAANVTPCATGYTYNATAQTCYETANTSNSGYAPSVGTQTANSMNGYLGTSGLAGWTPAIIALAIGVLFLAAFGFGGKKKY